MVYLVPIHAYLSSMKNPRCNLWTYIWNLRKPGEQNPRFHNNILKKHSKGKSFMEFSMEFHNIFAQFSQIFSNIVLDVPKKLLVFMDFLIDFPRFSPRFMYIPPGFQQLTTTRVATWPGGTPATTLARPQYLKVP